MKLRPAALSMAAVLAASFLSACSLLPSGPYREVKSYDLGVPAPAKTAASIAVQPFSADSACKFKLLYRAGGNEMIIDEYNKWTQPPGQMLTKYLRLAFRDDASEPLGADGAKYELSGSILAFEADLDAKQANLGVRYSISGKADSGVTLDRTSIFSEPLKDAAPGSVAAAMSKAAAKLAQAVEADVAALETAEKAKRAAAQKPK